MPPDAGPAVHPLNIVTGLRARCARCRLFAFISVVAAVAFRVETIVQVGKALIVEVKVHRRWSSYRVLAQDLQQPPIIGEWRSVEDNSVRKPASLRAK